MDPAPIDEPPVESLSKFWGVLEIAGAIAVIAPFVITMSSSSLQTENGHVVKFVFRDWIAVGGGAVAILCGLGAAARFKSTEKAKRGLRVAVVLLLLGLGAFQILRGFGVTASAPEMASSAGPTEDPMMREMLDRQRAKQAAKPPIAPTAADAPPVDLDTPFRAALALWEAGDTKALYASVTAGFRKSVSEEDLGKMIARVNAAVGKCGPVTPPITHTLMDGYWKASAQVKCDKTLVAYSAELVIDKDTATIRTINVNSAEKPHPAIADAEALARRFADDVLAVAMDHLAQDFDPRVIANIGDPKVFADKLRGVIADAGKRGEIKQSKSTAKSESEHDFAYDIAAAKHHLTLTLTAEFFMTRWFVTNFNIEPVEAK